MSILYTLSESDFKLENINGTLVMKTPIPGFSMVLFYSPSCEHCKTLIPIFNALPNIVGGCQFAIINVSKNRKCISISKETTSPITYVPLIILYIDGEPYMIYSGNRNINDIKKFIMDIAANIRAKQKFTTDKPKKDAVKKIPEYSIAEPICGFGKVCYLEFKKAYKT